MYTVKQLALEVKAFTKDDPDGCLEPNEIYRLLDVQGRYNSHLENEANKDPNVYYFRPRLIALSGEEIVHGNFLLLTYCSHDPFVMLHDFENLKSLETEILSDGGIINPFTTFSIALIRHKIVPYDIYFRDRKGLILRFNKQHQYTCIYHEREQYLDRTIKWNR